MSPWWVALGLGLQELWSMVLRNTGIKRNSESIHGGRDSRDALRRGCFVCVPTGSLIRNALGRQAGGVGHGRPAATRRAPPPGKSSRLWLP